MDCASLTRRSICKWTMLIRNCDPAEITLRDLETFLPLNRVWQQIRQPCYCLKDGEGELASCSISDMDHKGLLITLHNYFCGKLGVYTLLVHYAHTHPHTCEHTHSCTHTLAHDTHWSRGSCARLVSQSGLNHALSECQSGPLGLSPSGPCRLTLQTSPRTRAQTRPDKPQNYRHD